MGPRKKKQNEDDVTDRLEAMENILKKFKKEIEKIKEFCDEKTEKIEENCNNIIKKLESCENRIKTIEENYKEILIELERIETMNINTKPAYSAQVQRTEILHNMEISKPTFFGNHRDQHPKDFLNRLEEYFAIKQTYIGEKIIVVGDCLKSAAFSWFSTVRFQLSNYDDFKHAFMDEYWSRDIQIQVWSQCLNINQIPKNVSYREHFATWATKLRHLEVPRLSEPEIVKHIAKHYPGYLRAILVSLPDRTILAAMKVLGEEEHDRSYKDRYINNTQSDWSHQESNTSQDSNKQQQNNDQKESNRQNGGTNYRPQNNKWSNKKDNQYSSRENNQQINRVNVEVTEEVPEKTNERSNEITHAVNNIPINGKTVSPYIQCRIEGEPVQLLVDTGATISVLTKEIIDKIIQNNSRVPVLPVNGVQISNAVGKKICKVSKQIFCACKIGSATIYANFVQVENLNEKGIIGADVLQQYSSIHLYVLRTFDCGDCKILRGIFPLKLFFSPLYQTA